MQQGKHVCFDSKIAKSLVLSFFFLVSTVLANRTPFNWQFQQFFVRMHTFCICLERHLSDIVLLTMWQERIQELKKVEEFEENLQVQGRSTQRVKQSRFRNWIKNSLLTGDYSGWSYLSQWSLASWVFHLHSLPKILGWPTLYFPRWQTLLRRMFRWTLFQTLYSLFQTHHR